MIDERHKIFILRQLRIIVNSLFEVSIVDTAVSHVIVRDHIVVHVRIVDKVDGLFERLFPAFENLKIRLLVQGMR